MFETAWHPKTLSLFGRTLDPIHDAYSTCIQPMTSFDPDQETIDFIGYRGEAEMPRLGAVSIPGGRFLFRGREAFVRCRPLVSSAADRPAVTRRLTRPTHPEIGRA